jgi:hypothetical protein
MVFTRQQARGNPGFVIPYSKILSHHLKESGAKSFKCIFCIYWFYTHLIPCTLIFIHFFLYFFVFSCIYFVSCGFSFFSAYICFSLYLFILMHKYSDILFKLHIYRHLLIIVFFFKIIALELNNIILAVM